MPKLYFVSATASLAAIAVAALAVMFGSATPAKADAPFCSENYSRAGQGRVCAYYTYDQCRAATSGVGGSCSANAWYRPYEYEPAPRRHRRHRHRG
ncbi:MAG TPA: DUF3551 domain-containing protein [Afipia sp.]